MQHGPCDPCERNRTFENLIPFLKEVGISVETCFFTEFFMGLREGNKKEGKFPGAGDAKFVKRCQDFMKVQLNTQEPRLVLTLGKEVPPMLAALALSPKKMSDWTEAKTFFDLDKVGPVVHKVQFPGNRTTCSVVALVHPSRHYGNVKKCNRTYRTLQGHKAEYHEAEVAMVREALEQCGMGV